MTGIKSSISNVYFFLRLYVIIIMYLLQVSLFLHVCIRVCSSGCLSRILITCMLRSSQHRCQLRKLNVWSGHLYNMPMHPCPKYRPSCTDCNGHHTPSVFHLRMLVSVMPPTDLYTIVSCDAIKVNWNSTFSQICVTLSATRTSSKDFWIAN